MNRQRGRRTHFPPERNERVDGEPVQDPAWSSHQQQKGGVVTCAIHGNPDARIGNSSLPCVTPPRPPYSERSTRTGSYAAARRAGTYPATMATRNSANDASASDAGSFGAIP